MQAGSAQRSLWSDVLHVDRSQVDAVTALRNAIGVVAPLAVGAATGQLLVGLTVAIGALNVAFSDRPGPYRLRARRMLLAGAGAALSVFVGTSTGADAMAAVALAMLWAFAGGMLVALGPAATQIGLTDVVLLLVFAARPLPPGPAAEQAGLILAGGLIQTTLAIAAWPMRRFGPQRAALATALRRIADSTGAPAETTAPPAGAAMTEARGVLMAMGGEHDATSEALRTLLDAAERVRLELIALSDAEQQCRRDGEPFIAAQVEALRSAAGTVARVLAEAVASGRPPAVADALQRVGDGIQAVRTQVHEQRQGAAPVLVAILAHSEVLGGQLRAAIDAVEQGEHEDGSARQHDEAHMPRLLRLREPAAILRANLTLRSTACRHAVRLAGCVLVADAVGRGLGLPRTYWLPMTAVIVLKPDFGSTFSRGLGRAGGTTVGLLLATGLAVTLFGDLSARIVLIALLVFAIRSLGRANYGVLVVGVTALVVILTSFAGARPEATIVERGAYTLAGGVLALVAYAVWPTWERTLTASILADLLDSYRRYFAVVMRGYLLGGPVNAAVEGPREAARLARTNAEASVDRLRAEPSRSARALDGASGLLAASHRFVRAALALEAGMQQEPIGPAATVLSPLVADVDATLRAFARLLRDPTAGLGTLPDLRAEQQALVECHAAGAMAPAERARLAIVVAEADRIVSSINTMAGLLRHYQAGA